jgi:hypothetical protein
MKQLSNGARIVIREGLTDMRLERGSDFFDDIQVIPESLIGTATPITAVYIAYRFSPLTNQRGTYDFLDSQGKPIDVPFFSAAGDFNEKRRKAVYEHSTREPLMARWRRDAVTFEQMIEDQLDATKKHAIAFQGSKPGEVHSLVDLQAPKQLPRILAFLARNSKYSSFYTLPQIAENLGLPDLRNSPHLHRDLFRLSQIDVLDIDHLTRQAERFTGEERRVNYGIDAHFEYFACRDYGKLVGRVPRNSRLLEQVKVQLAPGE